MPGTRHSRNTPDDNDTGSGERSPYYRPAGTYPSFKIPSFTLEPPCGKDTTSPLITTKRDIPSYRRPQHYDLPSYGISSRSESQLYSSPKYVIPNHPLPDAQLPNKPCVNRFDIPSYNLRYHSKHDNYLGRDSLPKFARHYPSYKIPQYRVRADSASMNKSTTEPGEKQ